MIDYINNLLQSNGVNETVSIQLSYVFTVLGIVFICLCIDFISKRFLLKLLSFYIKRSKSKWDDIFLEKKVFEQIAHIPPFIVIHMVAPLFPSYQSWIQRLAFSFIILFIMLSLNKIIDSVEYIYRQYEISRMRPIKGYLQVVKIFVFMMCGIIIVSTIMERSPWILLSGLGAATAVILLIFQNSILGLVASIQLSTNDMVQIGDWIEMASHGADGAVTEISLHTVKVQNWDKTIVTIPTHALISESFKNWKGMKESGGRRIKRAVNIDVNSIKFCDEEMIERFKKIQYIEEYIEARTAEIEAYNKAHNINSESIVNGRHLTNIGTFRVYVKNYIENHPGVNKAMTRMVRQLQPSENGLPIEIYAFTSVTDWVEYEGIQSDIFDHLLAVIPEFDLKIYQNPSGNDFRKFVS